MSLWDGRLGRRAGLRPGAGAVAWLAGCATLGTLALASPAAATVVYVHICDDYGEGWFYVAGYDSCQNAVTGEIRGGTKLASVGPGANVAIQGVAINLAMPTPVIETGDRYAVAGNVAEYEGFWAVALAAAFKVSDNANLTAGVGYGVQMETWGLRLTYNAAFGGEAEQPAHLAALGYADSPGDTAAMAMGGPIDGFSGNGALFGGWYRNSFPYGGEYVYGDNDYWVAGGLVRGGWVKPGADGHPGTGAQVDLWSQVNDWYRFSAGGLGDVTPTQIIGVAGHLNARPTDNSLIGAFASLGERGGYRSAYGAVGLESRLALPRFVLSSQLGYVRPLNDNTYQAPLDGMLWAHGALDYFLTHNLLLEVNGGIAYSGHNNGFYDGGFDSTSFRWGGRIEYRPDGRAFSIYGEYRGADSLLAGYYNAGLPHLDFYDNTVLAGIRLFRNEPTLYDSAAYGASLADDNPVYGVNFRNQ